MESPRVRRSPLPAAKPVAATTPATPTEALTAPALPLRSRLLVWKRVVLALTVLAVVLIGGWSVYVRLAATAYFFGDSYTSAHGPSDHHRFSTILCKKMGWRESNFGVAGTMAEDKEQTGPLVDHASRITDQSISIWLVGFNDVLFQGRAIRLRDFLTCVESNAALLAIPASQRLANSDSRITYHGDWTTSPVLGGIRLAHRDAFATFRVAGTIVLVGTALAVNNTSRTRVAIDGKEYARFSNTMEEPTLWKTAIQPALIKVSGLPSGPHEVRVEAVDDGPAPFCWAAGLSGERLKPRVYVGGVVAVGPSGYELVPGNDGGKSIEASDLFSSGLQRSMAELAGFGLNIRYSRPTLDITTQIAADRIHPNDEGNASIAQQIAAVMSAN